MDPERAPSSLIALNSLLMVACAMTVGSTGSAWTPTERRSSEHRASSPPSSPLLKPASCADAILRRQASHHPAAASCAYARCCEMKMGLSTCALMLCVIHALAGAMQGVG
eukprot:scaffold55536_cov21-Tisochrysis_lutea.AAC.3